MGTLIPSLDRLILGLPGLERSQPPTAHRVHRELSLGAWGLRWWRR